MSKPGSSCRESSAGAGCYNSIPNLRSLACWIVIETMTMHTLLFQRTDHVFDHAILLRAILRAELLAQTVVAYQCGMAARRGDPIIVRPQQERCGYATKRPKTGDQSLLALGAVQALPLCDRCQPRSSRVWQSITSASVAQLSRPVHTLHRSVDQRSLVCNR